MGRGGFGAYLGVERAKNRVWHHLWQSPTQTAKNRQPRDKIGNVSHNSPLKVIVNDENQQKESKCFELLWYGGGLKGGDGLFVGVKWLI